MSSIFNLQRAFDPRHLSIDKEESEPIVVRGVHTFFFFFCTRQCQAPMKRGLTPAPQNILRNLWPTPVQPIPQLKNFFVLQL